MIHFLSHSLKGKLSLMIILSTLLPLLSFGLFSYMTASSISEEKAKLTGMNTLRQVETQLELMTRDIENMSVFLIGDNEIQRYLTTSQQNSGQQTSIIGFLTNLAYSKEYIANIMIEPMGGKPEISQTTILQSERPDIADTDPAYFVEHAKWWSPLYEEKTPMGVRRVISLIRPIRSTNTYQTIGKLTISLDEQFISRLLRDSVLEGSGEALLLDETDGIISSTDAGKLYRPVSEVYPDMPRLPEKEEAFTLGQGGERSTILYYSMPSVGWKLMGVIPFKEYSAQNRYVLALTAAAVGIAVLLSVALVLFFIQKVTRPISSLVYYLNESSPEEPIPMVPVASIDEVGQLVLSYNKLTYRIKKLTDQVKLNEALKKEADLLALQAQINPHFLYNTLSSIHWLALLGGDARIASMVGSLSDFLRFSLNGGAEYCNVRQEIEHVQNYVNIQLIRYPDRFDFQIRVDPGLMDRTMLKLLLQPLIENAMLHGIMKKEGRGAITVDANEHEQGIRFVISDNGAGMTQDKLQELRRLLAETDFSRQVVLKQGSYGLRNVHERLRLHYGNSAGLMIDSREGQGTEVSFIIPEDQEAMA
ncbi:sensor histidine kinase [Paenibacillus sp. S150]|uniref:cache domain-containing sensor histidine kinase n=1 Tax=Paenibacillus sp. S150 TaxID=2749826 RepID=UPI001C55E930|nr:sensor histidine kinase [Paenibacillus sp. S150]MBW4080163.1 sensor histidine kinase [Paenibacillus sp. S150]